VVETGFGVTTSCVGKLRWQTAGMFGEVAMAEPWDGVGEVMTVEPISHKRGFLGGCDAHTDSKTLVGTLQASGNH
jgi:hypothetical protein